jgi:hypothetical protein
LVSCPRLTSLFFGQLSGLRCLWGLRNCAIESLVVPRSVDVLDGMDISHSAK